MTRIGKQALLFANEAVPDKKYSASVESPIYEPSHEKPNVLLLCDASKTRALLDEIDRSELGEQEKEFLRAAAWRHAVFHYEYIADYYAHAGEQMQRLMERSALVIVDFDSAIEQGFVRLCKQVRRQYLEEYHGGADDAP